MSSARREREPIDWLTALALGILVFIIPPAVPGGNAQRVADRRNAGLRAKGAVLGGAVQRASTVQTRNLMENDLLLDLWTGSGQSVLFITHDLEEAVGLSDRSVVMTLLSRNILADTKSRPTRPRDFAR